MSYERLYPEQHDSLEGVPEPPENPFLFGHEDEVAQLAADYRSGRMHHALVLAGKAGIGKSTLAFRLARHVLSYPDARAAPENVAAPDMSSTTSRLIAQGAHPSLLHLTRPVADRGKGFKQALTVDEVRRVGRFLSMTAHDGGYRIVIVDPADDMNANAANALLKSLEEPPANCLFFLMAHSPGRLLPTIRSRCRILRLRQLEDDDLLQALKAIDVDLPGEEAQRRLLLDQAGGSVRDALMLLRFAGLDIVSELQNVVAAPCFDTAAAYKVADSVAARDDGARFGVFNDAVLGRISELARQAAGDGQLARAAELSSFWQEATERIGATRVYNLDRRQHVVGLLRQLHGMAH
ncbi:MAG: DNA polymerase III subunit delta' [Mesorhizobium sp.]|nr:DNA polymerase III subunit delta' [Mesorhizobium sp.]